MEEGRLHCLGAIGSTEPELALRTLEIERRRALEPVRGTVLISFEQVTTSENYHHVRVAGIAAGALLQGLPHFDRARIPQNAFQLFRATVLKGPREGGQSESRHDPHEAPASKQKESHFLVQYETRRLPDSRESR
jgi:hypothetical protein